MQPRSFLIDLDRQFNPSESHTAKAYEIMEKGKLHTGFKESDDVNKWISVVMDFDAILMRSAPDYQLPLSVKAVQF